LMLRNRLDPEAKANMPFDVEYDDPHGCS